MRTFPLVTTGNEALRYVFPTKQRNVQKAISPSKADEHIARLILFGNAVTMRCDITSDLDIVVDAPDLSEGKFLKLARSFYLRFDSEVDVIHCNTIYSELLKSEIDNRGCVCLHKARRMRLQAMPQGRE